ncbi:MAG: GTPase [Deltaproteobacteria bacterium]|nr:GTPase [Deltaproteobacteria bacterium]
MRKKVLIMGAAGRDFHNFNMCFRDNPEYEVIAFTAAQIPFIHGRTYPPSLSGGLYPNGIPIFPEEKISELIKKEGIDEAVFSYSDVSHEYVMHRASLCVALGADFTLLGSSRTMLVSKKPVISICAVRTGSGKSGVTRFAARTISEAGRKPIVIRHPMPYGDLTKQAVQRFKTPEDMRRAECTIEEMEEYETLLNDGITVYAGVDYGEILKRAEAEADAVIWDGGNNDLPFIKPDLEVVIADPLRPGHEKEYFPGESNVLRAGIVVINKANSAMPEQIELVKRNIHSLNPSARVIKTASSVRVDPMIKGMKVLVIEDGPTLTHGGMSYGAGIAAARKYGAAPVDVRPYAVGTIKEALSTYPKLENLLPAMGYSKTQIKELEETINATPCDAVLIATPVNLSDIIKIKRPAFRVDYFIEDMESPGLKEVILDFLKRVF